MPVAALKGVGPALAARLGRLGIGTLAELALHLPFRYQDRTVLRPLAGLRVGQEALVEGEIDPDTVESRVGGRAGGLLKCQLVDADARLELLFFRLAAAQRERFRQGGRLRCYGEVRAGGRSGGLLPPSLQMQHPEYRFVGVDAAPPAPLLTPVYPATEGLAQSTLRRLLDQALDFDDDALALREALPPALLTRLGLPPLPEAVRLLHRPPPGAAAALAAGRHPAQRRLVFEELLAHQLGLRRLRQQMRTDTAPVLDAGGEALCGRFLRDLPFELTAAQRRVDAEIRDDLAQPQPMLRLVQGDVGSGKTVIAALAALRAVAGGYQVALMAPTELLSEQHYRTLHAWLTPLAVEVVWLTGRLKSGARRAALEAIESGTGALVVGTHALFQQAVRFADLALVIVDEQHRFGVHQRLALRAKGQQRPHQLVMTATPIPRTLAMSAYADLDTSVIDELPPGRTPVTTVAVPDSRRDEVIARIGEVCREGRQAYWVCTLVEESETLQAQDAERTAGHLTAALPGLTVGLVHGRLGGDDKERVMAEFKAGRLDLLVATTVIEVGVDVPAASLMIIENPERLGLAQLHQLRGRVGRGSEASHCVLLYRTPLSAAARRRLAVVRDSNDGFVIAEQDLLLRGPGEVLGTRQTGDMQFRVADLGRETDAALLPTAQAVADSLLREHPDSAAAIAARWRCDGEQYGAV